jgi:tetratricopeptide (TPR) repeat protein
MAASVSELVDSGIRAYVEGRLDEARGLLDEALRREPGNSRARSYLILLHGGLGSLPAPAPAPAAPPAAARPPAPEEPRLPIAVAPQGVPGTPPPAPPPTAAGTTDEPSIELSIDVGEPSDGFAPSPWDDGPAQGTTIQLDSDGGLDLTAVADKSDLRPLVPEAGKGQPGAAPAKKDVDVWMSAAKDLHALGDFSGSLEMIEKILKVDPEHGEARDYLRQNEATLVAMYESKLGALSRIPHLAIKPEEVMWLNLDHRAGFLLSQIDGTVDYDSLFALSGLPRLDTARILATLIADGVIAS